MEEDLLPSPLKNFTPRGNPPSEQPQPAAEVVEVDPREMTVEDAQAAVGALVPLATASIEVILRNPSKFPSQAVAAAKLVYERKLGAVPDTVIQNNMQFIVKWQD